MNSKTVVLLNYSLMCGELAKVLSDQVPHITRSLNKNKADLSKDKDIMKIAEKFQNLVFALKSLDSEINNASEKLTLDKS